MPAGEILQSGIMGKPVHGLFTSNGFVKIEQHAAHSRPGGERWKIRVRLVFLWNQGGGLLRCLDKAGQFFAQQRQQSLFFISRRLAPEAKSTSKIDPRSIALR